MAGDYYGDYTRVREPTDFRVLADARLADAGAPASKPVSSLPTWLGLGLGLGLALTLTLT